MLVQNERAPDTKDPGRETKAGLAGVKPSTVARGDVLTNQRPDLAEKVRLGDIKPAAAHRQMRKDAVAERVAALAPTALARADSSWAGSGDMVSPEIGLGKLFLSLFEGRPRPPAFPPLRPPSACAASAVGLYACSMALARAALAQLVHDRVLDRRHLWPHAGPPGRRQRRRLR